MTTSSSASLTGKHNFMAYSPSFTSPNSLPYSDESRRLIDSHVTALVAVFPSLCVGTGIFTYNDGTTATLLYIEGTIPIKHMSVLIELPLFIWLLEAYPALPPSVFVSFPPGTAVRRSHRLVDPSGAVMIPYLSSWDFNYSNLIDLVQSLTRLFNKEPPFYLTEEAKKKSMIAKILENVEQDLAAMRASQFAELEPLFEDQSVLKKRRDVIKRGLEKLEDEKDELEQQLQIVLMNCDVLHVWIRENDEKFRKISNFGDDDEAFMPADAISKQKFECVTADKAIEDAIYELDLVLREGGISYSEYLKNVRTLSREQFFHRAMAMKLHIHS